VTETKSPVNAGDVIDGKYRIERVLGAGGMGVVVVATHLQLEQKVAIKFLLPEVSKSADAVARFSREARAAAKIQSEHVARVLDVATHANGAPYMVMEYLEGQDLDATLEEHKALPIERAVDYVLQALEALAEAHVAGIVHRDLKPANIFLARRADGSSVVKVLDFGISKLAGEKDYGLTSDSAQMGSPLYMSPEQLQRTRDTDARSDIWAIGVILHELLTGTAPFMADTLPEIIAGILTLPPLRMRLPRPDVPLELEAVVLRCLEKNPKKRFQNVAELAVALGPFAPEGSRVSTERIVRVVAGRKEISLPPSSTPGLAFAPQAVPELPTQLIVPAVVIVEPAAPEPAATGSSWQTTGVLRSARRGRRIAIAVFAGLVVATVVVAGIVVRRSPGPAAPSATPDPSTVATIGAPDIPPPLAPAAPSDTESASAAPSASSAPPSGPKPPAGRPAPAATRAAPAAPAPTIPGAADFGGRK
jgi:eukaryotic-like serine/threonine-protein kinase